MEYQIQLAAVPVKLEPRQTSQLIQWILAKKLKKLQKVIDQSNINSLYPSAEWGDDVTPLTAAVICGNVEICNFLLRQNADPDIASTNIFTPLHYAAKISGVPLSIVRKLLLSKANPDGHPVQRFTPLQFAACNNRIDIVTALIEAGAEIQLNYGIEPQVDVMVEKIIQQLPSGNKTVEKCRMFYNFFLAVPNKSQSDVFSLYREHFFEEHPFKHFILFELYFNAQGLLAEQYRESCIKWLKDSGNTDKYIKGFIQRFPKILHKLQFLALKSLQAVVCMIKQVSFTQFNEIVPILIKIPIGIPKENMFNELLLNILYVVLDKSSKQKASAGGLNTSVLMELCNYLIPLINCCYSAEVRILAYRLFAYLYEFVPDHIKSCGLQSVPYDVIFAAEIRTDEAIKEKLRELDTNLKSTEKSTALEASSEKIDCLPSKSRKKRQKRKNKNDKQEMASQNVDGQNPTEKVNLETTRTSVQETNSTVHPFKSHIEKSPVAKKWHSKRWAAKLDQLVELEASKVYRLGNLTIGTSTDFQIAKGSDGTQVFIGLKDDGTEVAVKRMLKSNYQDLKNEKEFLQLPKLENPCIVRYVDFAEDEHFGYLVLQLCEYTLEEYIENHLPTDSSQQLQVMKRLVKEVLYSLKVLHSEDTKVLHRDIKPQNVLIDVTGKARLADFGISRRLNPKQTTLHTGTAGTKCWKASETFQEDDCSRYKRSSDIQVAGMLVYYILSRGEHPFGKGVFCEPNIATGKYSLKHLEDEVAKDLVESMINHDPNKRPTVEETLVHPFFWTDEKKVDYLKKLGNEKDVENCRNAEEELLQALEEITVGKTFSDWKTKISSEVVQKLDGKKKAYPENTLGLLRFIRNLHEHYPDDAEQLNLMTLFPDLFGNAFKFAKNKGWNNKPHMKKWFCSVSVI